MRWWITTIIVVLSLLLLFCTIASILLLVWHEPSPSTEDPQSMVDDASSSGVWDIAADETITVTTDRVIRFTGKRLVLAAIEGDAPITVSGYGGTVVVGPTGVTAPLSFSHLEVHFSDGCMVDSLSLLRCTTGPVANLVVTHKLVVEHSTVDAVVTVEDARFVSVLSSVVSTISITGLTIRLKLADSRFMGPVNVKATVALCESVVERCLFERDVMFASEELTDTHVSVNLFRQAYTLKCMRVAGVSIMNCDVARRFQAYLADLQNMVVAYNNFRTSATIHCAADTHLQRFGNFGQLDIIY